MGMRLVRGAVVDGTSPDQFGDDNNGTTERVSDSTVAPIDSTEVPETVSQSLKDEKLINDGGDRASI